MCEVVQIDSVRCDDYFLRGNTLLNVKLLKPLCYDDNLLGLARNFLCRRTPRPRMRFPHNGLAHTRKHKLIPSVEHVKRLAAQITPDGVCKQYRFQKEADSAETDGIPHGKFRNLKTILYAVVAKQLFCDWCLSVRDDKLHRVSERRERFARLHDLYAVRLFRRQADVWPPMSLLRSNHSHMLPR